MLNPTALADIASNLRTLAADVQRTSLDAPWQLSIPFSAIRESDRGQLQEIEDRSTRGARYIYAFRVAEEDSAALHAAFVAAKQARTGGRAYCRVNGTSPLLYVGSSANLYSRMKDHLGFGNKSTYAMHLSHWLPARDGDISLQIWQFSETTPSAVIQAIEDGLWALGQPMLGRQGTR